MQAQPLVAWQAAKLRAAWTEGLVRPPALPIAAPHLFKTQGNPLQPEFWTQALMAKQLKSPRQLLSSPKHFSQLHLSQASG